MDRSIDYVIAVAECKSISQAAEMLYISQPSLSRYLSNLENELGVNLFVRTLNGTELTAAGKIYLEYAKEIKLLKETMNSKLKELKREKKSRIRIGMPLNAASLAAFDVVKEVEKKYPDCGVEIYNIFSKDMEKALKEWAYDFVIGPMADLSKNVDYDLMYRDFYVLVVPKRYDLETYAEYGEQGSFPVIDMKKLQPMDYIFQDETTFVRKGINRILEKQKLSIAPRLVVTSSTLALQAAENGFGCCIVSTGHLAYLNQSANLKVYLIKGEETSSCGVAYLHNKIFSEEEKCCIALIRRALREGEKKIMQRFGTWEMKERE